LRWVIPPFKLDTTQEQALELRLTPFKHAFVCFLCVGGFCGMWWIERAKLMNRSTVAAGFLAVIVLAIISFFRLVTATQTKTRILCGREWAFLALATITFSSLYAFDVNSWRYSFIGDEYSFYSAAEKIGTPELPGMPWLEACGVYCGFPFFTTIVQKAHLLLFGHSNFGWRMSAVTATALCIPPCYVFLRRVARYCSAEPYLCAAVACILLFSLEPIQIWAKIGKPHAFFLPPIFFSLGTLAWAQESGRVGLYGIAGLLAGVGMFFSPVGPSLAFVSAVIFQMLFYAQHGAGGHGLFTRALLLPLWLYGLGALLGGAPILVQSDYFESMSKLNLESSEAIANRVYFVSRTFQALGAFLWHNTNGHFMLRNPFNFILATFIFGAFCSRGRTSLLVLGAALVLLAVFAVCVGGMSQYNTPPPSRIHLMAIPFAVLATIGLCNLLRIAGRSLRIGIISLALFSFPLTYMKISLYNPFVHPVDKKASAIRAVQTAKSKPVIVLISGEDPLLKQILLCMTEKDATIIYESVDKMRLHEIINVFKAAPETAAFVVPEDLPLANMPEVSHLKNRFYVYERWSISDAPDLPPALGTFVNLIERLEISQ
jgi:hypothetical protein